MPLRGQFNHMVVFLRDEMKKDEELKKIVESFPAWQKITSETKVEDLEAILYDVGDLANTTIPVDITSVKIDDDDFEGQSPSMPPPPEEHHGFDDFEPEEHHGFDDEPSEKQEEKKVKKVKKVKNMLQSRMMKPWMH